MSTKLPRHRAGLMLGGTLTGMVLSVVAAQAPDGARAERAGARASHTAAPKSAATYWRFDARSNVQFNVKILGLFKKHGEFKELRGSLDVRHQQLQVHAQIQSGSVLMADAKDTQLLKSAPYFDAEHFPEVVFDSAPFSPDLLSQGGEISGTLQLKGVTLPQRFRVIPQPCAQTPAWRCPLQVEGALKRSDFGMHARRGIVSDQVQLRLMIWAHAAPSAE